MPILMRASISHSILRSDEGFHAVHAKMRSAVSKTSGATVQVMRTPSTSMITCGEEVGLSCERSCKHVRSIADGLRRHAAQSRCCPPTRLQPQQRCGIICRWAWACRMAARLDAGRRMRRIHPQLAEAEGQRLARGVTRGMVRRSRAPEEARGRRARPG